jgi:hypothetical protein
MESIGTDLAERGSPWRPSDGEEDGQRQHEQMAAGARLRVGEQQWTTGKLAVQLFGLEEDRARWSMVTL